jgi:undecaprenyl-diphosphatase
MENIWIGLLIAVIQGITEWVPVSSSGHLVLFESILGFNEGGLLFDVALHFGTLMAVFVYFGKDITDILEDWLKGRWGSKNSKLGGLILLATIPAGLVGWLLFSVFELAFQSLTITALGFGVTGLLMFISSLDFSKKKNLDNLGVLGSLIIGGMQVLSLLPGISRSGTTIAGGILWGLDEKDAMRFSFLMSIPVIFGANILAIGNQNLNPGLIWATLVSFIVGLGAIHLLYTRILLDKKNLRWFGVYAILLAIGILVWLVF